MWRNGIYSAVSIYAKRCNQLVLLHRLPVVHDSIRWYKMFGFHLSWCLLLVSVIVFVQIITKVGNTLIAKLYVLTYMFSTV